VNTAVTDKATNRLMQANIAFAIFVSAALIVCWNSAVGLVKYSLHDQPGSHIVLIPVIIAYLIVLERRKIFASVSPSIGVGVGVLLIGGVAYWIATRSSWFARDNDSLSAATLAFALILVGTFVCSYGLKASRAALFPLCMLLLMVPLPDQLLNWIIHLLQQGSTDIATGLFHLFGVPVLRDGFILSVPTVTIEVAPECSGIRSSIALFITCVLAARLYLRTPWKIALFVLLVFPLSIIKNGIRIVTLTLLSIYVDPGFLHGSLHSEGGFVFFLLALALLYPVFIFLEKSEKVHSKNVDLAPH
jgi:exosortase